MGVLSTEIVLESMEKFARDHLEPTRWSDHDCADSQKHNQQLQEFRSECEQRLTDYNNNRIVIFKQERGIL